MNLIKSIAIDDEPLALEVIKRFAEKTPDLELLQTFRNPLDAVAYIREAPVDLIFLDIHMPDLNGLEMLQSLSAPPMIVFTTAHAEYALASYDFDAVDYLLKPIMFDRFLKAVNKVHKQMAALEEDGGEEEGEDAHKEFVFIKSDTRFFKVNYSDILYIEGMRDYIALHTHQQRILTLMSMTNMLKKLPALGFKRIHKSYIVGVAHISLVQNNKVKVGETELPISNTYKEDFLRFIEGRAG